MTPVHYGVSDVKLLDATFPAPLFWQPSMFPDVVKCFLGQMCLTYDSTIKNPAASDACSGCGNSRRWKTIFSFPVKLGLDAYITLRKNQDPVWCVSQSNGYT